MERFQSLDVLTMRETLDDSGLDAVLEHEAVTALQGEGPAIRDVVRERRHDDQADTSHPRGRVERYVELVRDDVVHARHGEHDRSEEHTSELLSLMRFSFAFFCLKK